MQDRDSQDRGSTAWVPWTIAVFALGVALGALLAPRAAPPPPAEPGWDSYAEVYAKVAPVVVNVRVEAGRARVGSGFAVSDEHVVTARHIVAGAEDGITVRTIDGSAVQAAVVGTDAATDLAVLEAQDAGFKPAALGISGDLEVGDTVLAIGNPYGLGHSLAVGVLGSRGRVLEASDGQPRVEFLQLTIPLNPGNSGGPIFDERGRVVGVLAGTHAQGQAIAFAVPVEILRETLPELMEGARMTSAFLGLRTVADAEGVRVVSVTPSGPAGQAGIRPGDVVTRVGSRQVRTPSELRAAVDALPVTSHVFVRLLRGGEELAVDVGLEDRAEQPVVAAGMILRPEPGTGGRVVAVRPRSRAERSGIRSGDVIRTVAGVPVQAPADVQELLAGGWAGPIEVLRDGAVVALQLEDAPG